MPFSLTGTFRQALVQLQRTKDQVERQIAALQTVLGGTDRRGRRGRRRRGTVAKPVGSTRRRRRRRKMSAAAHRAVSRRMKAYWAKRRQSKQSAKSRPSRRRPTRQAANISKPVTEARGPANAARRQKRNQSKTKRRPEEPVS
jgi:hypothetical protein